MGVNCNMYYRGNKKVKKYVLLFRSRSLEPLNSAAMWSSQIEEIVLIKGEKGLGFSILDYQVNKPFCK